MRSRLLDVLASDSACSYLVELLANLTVAVWDRYDKDDSLQVNDLRGPNELNHKILGQVSTTLEQGSRGYPGYPDDVFVESVVETAQLYGYSLELRWAMLRALERYPVSD